MICGTNALVEAAALFEQICTSAKTPAEPFLLSILPDVLENLGNKASDVRSACDAALKAFIAMVSPFAVPAVLKVLFDAIEDAKKWQTSDGTRNFYFTVSTFLRCS